MPDWLWWLSPVLVSPLAAVAWTAWAGRSRGPEDPDDSMRAYGRFRDALGSPLPAPAAGTDRRASWDPAAVAGVTDMTSEPAAATAARCDGDPAPAAGSAPAGEDAPDAEHGPTGPATDAPLPVPAGARLPRQSLSAGMSGAAAQEPSRFLA